MSTAIRSVRFQGWDDEQEEIERKRSERGVQQRKELKKRKLSFKKAKREMADERKREGEEIDLLLRYLYSFREVPPQPSRLRDFLQGNQQISRLISVSLFDGNEDYYEDFTGKLNDYVANHDTSYFFSERNRPACLLILLRMKEARLYTPLDRFLQSIFMFSDETLRRYLLDAGNDRRGHGDRVDISGLLRPVYRQAQERDDNDGDVYMRRFLSRTLNEKALRDRNPPGGIDICLQGFRRLESVFVAMKIYTREGQGNEDSILTSGSSDGEDGKQEEQGNQAE